MAFEKLNEDALEQVTGGAAFIDGHTNQIGFNSNHAVYTYKNCTYSQVTALCNSLIGKYATNAEYDQACIAALKKNGWI